MDFSFIPIEVVPSKTILGLDQLRRSYKTELSAEDAMDVAPAIGTPDETFPGMLLKSVNTPESAESATRIDLVYMGYLVSDTSFIPIETVLSKTMLGLDQLKRSYRTGLDAEAAIAAAPAIGTPDTAHPNMFLKSINTPDSAESATRVDLVYMGYLSVDSSFIPIEVVPSKTPFGLDQLRRSYKTGLSAEDAMAAAPAVGTADAVFGGMFLMPIATPETEGNVTRVDLIYMGTMTGTLPAVRHSSGSSVQSASSVSDGIVGHAILSQPVNIQFYAPTNKLEWISVTAGAAPPGGFAADPTGDPNIISMTSLEASIYTLGLDVHTVLITYFGYLFTDTIESTEIVPGQYWSNIENKQRTIVTIPASTDAIP